MRFVLGSLLLLATVGCPTSGTVPLAAVDGGTVVGVGDGGFVIQPATNTCQGNANCISGVARLDPLFSAKCPSPACPSWQVALFRTYPAGTEQPVTPQPQLVAVDGTWAFSGVDVDAGAPWPHYYVQATAVFASDAGQNIVSTVVGPLTAPTFNVDITLRPIQAVAYESRLAGGNMQLDWVLARLFDPATGSEITSGAEAAVTVGGSVGGTTPLTPTSLGSAGEHYYVAFSQPPAAQPTYTVTASHPAFGDAGLSVGLVADAPSFDGTITSPDGGAAPSPVRVSWTPQPQADFELVELYAAQDGGSASAPAFVSPQPNPPDVTSESVAGLDAGTTYLVNVAYTKANCPADAGGCVQAAAVAATTVNVAAP